MQGPERFYQRRERHHELQSAIRKIEADAPRNASGKFFLDAANTIGKAARGLYPDPVASMSQPVRDAMGGKTKLEEIIEPMQQELNRRKYWNDPR